MANILLGVTGSVAALRTPELHDALRRAGHEVKIVATRASLYFFDEAPFRTPERILFLDDDEWPGRDEGRRWQRDDPVLHIELRRWADLFAIAPLDANTLAKLAHGLCDNCLTCVWRAWDPGRPVVLAPAMNTLMWQHPLTAQHLRALGGSNAGTVPFDSNPEGVAAWLNAQPSLLRVVGPQSKRLACGDVGMGGIAETDSIVAAVNQLLQSTESK